jgi:capsular exopolysaccharide synthesis family protein
MNGIDFGTLYYEVRRFWWILVLALLAGGGLFFYRTKNKPPLFTSESKMVLSGKINMQAGATYSEDGQDFMGTQAAILQGSEVRSRTMKSLASQGQTPRGDVDLNVAFIPRTTIFLLRATGGDPIYTQAMLQQSMQEFIGLRKEIRWQRADDASVALKDEVARLQHQVEIESQALNEFQRKFNVVSLQDESNADTSYLSALRKRVADLRVQRSVVATGTGSDPSTAGSAIPTGGNDGNGATDGSSTQQQGSGEKLDTAKQDLTMLQVEKQRLLTNLRPQHPRIKQLNVRIETAQKLVDFLSSQITDNTKDRLTAIDREMEALTIEADQRQTKLVELNNNLTEYHNLKTRLETSQSTFDKLTATVQNVDVGKQLDQEVIGILENATPAYVEKKNLIGSVGQGSMLGLILGCGAVYLLSRSLRRFQTVDSVKRTLGLPIFGKILRDRWVARERTVLDCTGDHLGFAESFRNLRSAVLYMPEAMRLKRCFSVTSAVPGEGKSTVAVNLAIALAATTARTLLVDADLRRGKLHHLLKVRSSPGFSHLITNAEGLNQVLQPTHMPHLMLLPCGPRIADIGEQLMRYGIDELMDRLLEHFDYVILDTPPVLSADDAATLAAKTDWTMFVVRLGYSRPTSSQRAIEELTNRRVRVGGVVVNGVPKSQGGHTYYHYNYHPLENRPFARLTAGEGNEVLSY